MIITPSTHAKPHYSILKLFFASTQLNGSTMLNLSLLTSDMWAVLIRIFAYHEKVPTDSELRIFDQVVDDESKFLFSLKILISSQCLSPGWLDVLRSFCSCCSWPHSLFRVSYIICLFLVLLLVGLLTYTCRRTILYQNFLQFKLFMGKFAASLALLILVRKFLQLSRVLTS